MLWRISERLEDFTEMSTQLLNTSLGKWCLTPTAIRMTKRSMYVDHHEHEGSEGVGRSSGQNKYIFIYPSGKPVSGTCSRRKNASG